ncbi:unnamed protein product [Lymnaea stagnalis]|uniref:Major facilitator superfamily (MFS) profile domain-containing protein n=1 Tax=Lymnaea stagnalis TaxID=6523 RepID=A0AAV2HTA0_LYMST
MEGGIQGIVIVFSAFMIQVLAFGNYAVVGIYTVHLLEEFNNDAVGVSLISSIHFAILLGCGPIISFLMTKFSYRKLSLIGAVLVFIGILCTPYVVYLPAMYVFFGVFAGLGGSLIYFPSHVLSGLYYDKYRSLSTGVATAGTGMGAIVMPLVVGILIEEYTWKGSQGLFFFCSLLILAGLQMHLLIFALLMLPPPILPRQSPSNDSLSNPLMVSQTSTSTDKLMKGNLGHRFPERPHLHKKDSSQFSGASGLVTEHQEAKQFKFSTFKSSEHNETKRDGHWAPLDRTDEESLQTSYNSNSRGGSQTAQDEDVLLRRPRVRSPLPADDISFVFRPSYLSWVSDKNCSNRSSWIYDMFPQHVLETAIVSSSDRPKTAVNGVYKNKHSAPSSHARSTTAGVLPHKTLKETMKHHLLIFANFKFIIYLISTFFWSLSTTMFLTFGPELIVMKGHSAYSTAMVFTFYGVGQLIGCIIISILGSCIGKRMLLYIISNSLTGVFISISPVYDSYLEIAVVLLCMGLAYGGILGLYMIVMVDIVGVNDMEIGLGYIMFSSGLGCFTGPPLGGYLGELYGNYDASFYIAGALAVLAGLIMVLIYITKGCSKKPVVV